MVITRRQLLITLAAAAGVGPVVVWAGRPGARVAPASAFPVAKTPAEWRRILSPQQYSVLRDHATERPFISPLNGEKRLGAFVCAGCGHRLFSSRTKFDSGTGWPSFWEPLPDAIGTSVDRSYFMVRTEVHCAQCGGHLGHVFDDGPRPTGLRYCINGAALRFEAEG